MPAKSKTATPPSIEPEAYRALMRHQAGAVAIIAVGKAGARTGLTATAVCSVTDSPPTVLVCVNRSASAHKLIAAERCFSINLLAGDQRELALRFSGKKGLEGEARFDVDTWTTARTGAPILKGALASLDCTLVDEHQIATHSIYVGRVSAGLARDDGDPLVYFRGAFCGAVPQ